uniref:dTTP/UTP pyrophosphatase n=1 Tax=Thermorudis peleae TaxID=1382356 RepID=A0A831WZR0_9BACT
MRRAPVLVLASASPRRRELLGRLGVTFDVDPAGIPEALPAQDSRAERVARRLARAKALAVAARYPALPVLAADTVVVRSGRLLSKPADEAEAWSMLRELRGRRHRVITAVAVARGRRIWVGHAVTWVQMREYSDHEIAASIARGDPFDKAGAYAIQDERFHPVAEYRGCYCNVVGLPLGTVIDLLRRAGIAVCPSPELLPPECAYCPLLASVRSRRGLDTGS